MSMNPSFGTSSPRGQCSTKHSSMSTKLYQSSFSRNRDSGDYVGEDAVGVVALQFGFGLEHDAVAQDRLDGALDVVGDQVVAAIEGGRCLCDEHQAERGAWAGAEQQRGPLAGAAREREDVGVELGLDADGAD